MLKQIANFLFDFQYGFIQSLDSYYDWCDLMFEDYSELNRLFLFDGLASEIYIINWLNTDKE